MRKFLMSFSEDNKEATSDGVLLGILEEIVTVYERKHNAPDEDEHPAMQ